MDTRTKEAIRYLGYGNHAVDGQTLALLESSLEELDRVAEKRIIYRIFDVHVLENDQLEIGKLHISSRNLSKNLRGCKEAILLGATLGVGVDQLMRRYSLTNMPRVVVLQAAAAAMLEEYLNQWQTEKAAELEARSLYLRPRFSPGYGDFDISNQKMILRMLEADKRIGLTLTGGGMLNPTKSVTAVAGISEEKKRCPVHGCEECGKVDCAYRRNE